MHIDDTKNNISSLKNNMYEYNYTESGIIVRSDASFVKLEFLFQPIIDLKPKYVSTVLAIEGFIKQLAHHHYDDLNAET